VYILSAQQIKDWDAFTIQHEPVSSVDLMERAAAACVEWILKKQWIERPFRVFCGKGNNGGDGLAIARMLLQRGIAVSIYILENGKPGSPDFQINLQRLHEGSAQISYIQDTAHFPAIGEDEIIVDALFGYGLNAPLKEPAASLVRHINASNAHVIAIDLPSGLFADLSSIGGVIIHAQDTLSFQTYKTALLVQENAPYIGNVHILDIGLHPRFLETATPTQYFVTDKMIRALLKPRGAFAHKGIFGHALLIAGSYGKIGAAVLAAKAIVHSGAGLLTCYLPSCGYNIMQTSLPEAMVLTDEHEKILTQLPSEIEKYTVIGVGPGIGTAEATQKLISFVIRRFQKPIVVDADGLNCLSLQPELIGQLPRQSVLTPHPKEFDRLFGHHENDFSRLETAKQKATAFNINIVLKGHHTLTATSDGKMFFNSTGNPGMAKGGSGDVLTGVITSLAAQGYEPAQAAIIGVYLHGLAGDYAANALGQHAMTPTHTITFLSQAFRQFS
jgi:ADP-dependent NAD(P)H-hydrate dehydratase / NAD(P)H-hydrate epimerase